MERSFFTRGTPFHALALNFFWSVVGRQYEPAITGIQDPMAVGEPTAIEDAAYTLSSDSTRSRHRGFQGGNP